ncbi:ABC transporter permease [Candidatus Babeliales bacterium]|nr:ABC transporter permease [Candidatus Babeliales bacterium]
MSYNVLQSFMTLLIRDARTFQQHILTRMIDACVWSGTSLYVSQYLLPLFGTSAKFASFLVLGNLALWGMFEVGTNMSILLGDLHGANSMSYYLTLPIPTSLIFIRIALMDAFKSFIPTLPMLLVAKLVLQENLDLTSIHYPKMILSWIMAHLFFGFFGLFISSLTHNFEYVTTIRQRVLFPLWFLGCYYFSWDMLLQVNPTLAYLNLFNPTMYIMESTRGCTNTSLKTIPFEYCMLAIIGFTCFFGYLGIRQFKKRLDCL